MNDPAYEQELREREKRQWHLEDIVRAAIAQVEETVVTEIQDQYHFSIFFGAMGVDPVHLVIWYFLNRDADLAEARSTGWTDRIDAATRSALRDNGYPEAVIPQIHVSFGSHEDVERQTDGNYWYYLK